MILVSACLLGINCRYDGKGNQAEGIKEFLKDREYMIVCPEQLGGLTTPRKPCEINGNKVISEDGEDFTDNFIRGAAEVEKIGHLINADCAILKDGSPSCGSSMVYDGTFSGNKIIGKGYTCKKLEEMGINIFSEKNYSDMR